MCIRDRLTGGELPAMVMIDTISRLVPGVLNNGESAQTESHSDGLLEYPQYSRPEVWHEKTVPDVLLSGHHANIEKWRREQSVIRTAKSRPDLLKKADLTNKEWNYVRQLKKQMKEEEEDDSCFTETLAKIYVKQQRYSKALEIIKKLSLKYPKKNAYFADQIRFLEKLIINAKSK